MIGKAIGPYQIVAELGRGGMGEVYRARDTNLNRDVALKILPEAFAQDPERLARFRREAQVLASLNHPNIGHIYGFEDSSAGAGHAAPLHALVLELVEGPTLADQLAHGPLAVADALRIGRQIGLALEAAHDAGVIHRDLKPANIKLTSSADVADATVKVLDFGLAKAFEAPGGQTADSANSPTLTNRATALGVILGTAAYMAPEQAKGRTVDKRADIWSFGVVLYEMLTGRRLFRGDDVSDTLAEVLKTEPDWTALPSGTPPGIHRLLHRCLQRDPRQRLRDIGDARLEIDEALAAPAVPDSPAPPRAAGRAIWLERVAWLLALGATIVAALVIRPARIDAPETRLEIVTPPAPNLGIAISPDGRSVAYAASSQGRGQVWVRNLQSSDARLLATFDRNVSPLFYQPDGRSLVVSEAAVLKEVSIADGSVHPVSNQVGGIGVSWNADGVILFAPANAAPLYRMPAAGGPREEATRVVPPLIGHRYPSFLPDGRHFVFLAVGPPAEQGIYIGELGSKESRRLAAADTAAVWVPPGFIVYGRQDAVYAQRVNEKTLQSEGEPFFVADHPLQSRNLFGSIALAASRSGTLAYRRAIAPKHQLQWLDRSGHLIGEIGGVDTEEFLGTSRISPDGHTIATIRRVNGNTDVWTVDNTPQSAPLRLTSNEATELGVVWSGDGSRLVFSSSRQGGGLYDLYVKTLGSAGPEAALIASPENKIALDWSRDNRFLLYSLQGHEQVARDIWAMPMQGDRQPFQVTAVPGDSTIARFSPNGRWIVFQSTEQGAGSNIFVQPFPGPGRRWRISTEGGVSPAWTHDGREIIYVGPDQRVMAVSITPSADGAFLDHGPPTALFSVRRGSTVEPAPDSDRFLVNMVLEDPAPTPITLILNWQKK